MDTSNYDSQIQDLEIRKQELALKMENASQVFKDSSNEFARTFVQEEIETEVTRNPSVAKSAGMDELRKLKVESQALTDRIPDLIEQHLNRDELWSHRKKPEQLDHFGRFSRYSHYGNRMPDELDDAIRYVVGPTQALLEHYGFHKFGKRDNSDPNRYRYNLQWSENMKSALRDYDSLNQEYERTNDELQEVKREKEAYEVKNMWDEA